MTQLLAMAALALAVAGLLAWPFRRRPQAADGGGGSGDTLVAIYAEQLAELELARAAGRIAASAAEAARLEIQRRLLASADAAGGSAAGSAGGPAAGSDRVGVGRRDPALLAALLAVVLAGGGALYLQVGRPFLPDQPFAGRRDAGAERVRQLGQARAAVVARPQDAAAWAALGDAAMAAREAPAAIDAFARARALDPARAAYAAAEGEALAAAKDGAVEADAKDAFRAALALDPADARARFYLALARVQDGDAAGAIADWTALARTGPADAPWQALVRRRIAETAQRAGIDPATPDAPEKMADGAAIPALPPGGAAIPALPPGGAATPALPPGGAAIAALPPAERDSAIRGMVAQLAARLANRPDDIEGWQRLARAYQVLGEPARAGGILKDLADRWPDRIDLQLAYAHLLYPPEAAAATVPPPEFLAVMRRVLALDGANAEALWFIAQDVAGDDPGQARALLARLLARLPADSPARATIGAELARIGGG